MLIKQKIKAFTIIELLVSMTLSGILLVFSFVGYNQIQKLFKNMVLKFKSHTDTFYLVAKKQDYQFLKYNAETSSNLIEKFNCQVFFQNQKFDVSFHKQYDATSILTKNLEELPPDEFN